ncbi:acetate kinase [Lentzea albidocapillata subsp. violacea]|uniref:Acetate kinase n=1 Tax=Lentzea albidocapillata subsp. violacea TaxID=128104 RepID=A0A1G9X8J0_9PSEU|nr:acetate kinase [Lentzea albidocapillata]SDM93048.1 acetate kinase [Lentzea albidocapillata subsp. violacea]
MSTVLTVNAGSNSLKAHLVDTGSEEVLDSVDVEGPPDADEARRALDDLLDGADDVVAAGHRLVHGGPGLRAPTLVDDDAIAAAHRAEALAPLHVPPALRLLEVLRERLSGVSHVLCPDTAFHTDLPEVAATYPLPAEWRERYGLRRYGFHGLSYRWALDRAAVLLERSADGLSVLMTHLGGGCSVCAVRDGRSVDTSMGFTPLEGVPMSKRSGSVDPGMLLWLLRNGIDLDALEHGLNHESGLLGLSGGRSGDTRDLVAAAGEDPAAALALRVFAHRVRRELAAAATSLDRLDALVFTGEIGWDQPEVRADVVAGLSLLDIPRDLTAGTDGDGPVSPPDAVVPVLVVRPREELQLCRDTLAAL